MSARRRLLACLGAGALAIGMVTPSEAAVTPPGTFYSTPQPIALRSWGVEGPRAGNVQGTVMGDGTVRATAAPTVVIQPADVAGDTLVNRIGGGVTLITDGGVVGLASTDPSDPTGSWLLWRTDLSNGRSTTRAIDATSDTTRLVGATSTAWVTIPQITTLGPWSMAVTFWPFDGSPSTTYSFPGPVWSVLAGADGLLHLDADPAGAESLRLTSTDLSTTATLRTWTSGIAAGGNLAMSRGAVGWYVRGELGYWDAIRGASSAPIDICCWSGGLVTVVRGAVAVNAQAGIFSLWDTRVFLPTGGGLSEVPLSGGGRTLTTWSSAAPDGTPVLGGELTLSATGSSEGPAPTFTSWVQWFPGSAALSIVVPAPPLMGAPLATVTGSNGSLITAYWTSPTSTVVELRTLRGTTTPVVASIPLGIAGPTGVAVRTPRPPSTVEPWTSSAEDLVSGLYGLSGVRSAIPEWTSTTRTSQRLVLRDGARVTGRVTTTPRSVSTSGPYTAFTPATAGYGRVVGPTGVVVAELPSSARLVAQDGGRTAYSTSDGALWLRDVTVAVSSANPRKVAQPCPRGTGACVTRVFLVGSRLVAEARWNGGHLLVVADLARRTTRTLTLSAWTCPAMNGPVVLCVRNDPSRGATVDASASRLTLRPLPGSVPAIVFAGRLVGWTAATDPRTGYPTRVALAPLPTANGAIGRPRVLGPWSSYGDVLSTAYPWRPQLSVTDPLTSWTLTMRSSSGRLVRTWSGRALDSDIRGIAWNARDSRGRALPVGTYRWTLTGTSRYGAPVATIGSGTATGTVRIVRQIPATSTIAATRTATRSATTATITTQLRRTGTTAGIANRLVTLWARVGTAAWHQIDSAVTSATGRARWTALVTARTSYQVRHPADPVARAAASTIVTVRR